MTQIVQANKSEKRLRIALYGDSATGKTHTALAFAKTLGERVLVIDSEDGASHSFSDLYAFNVLKIDEPTIENYTAALDMAIKHQDKFDCIVIDSLSHAWQNALNQVSQNTNTQLGWGKVTPKWDAMIHRIKRLHPHVIVTMRAKTRQDGNKWIATYDSRENSDYDFDMIIEMNGLAREKDNVIVAKATIKKNRFNTGEPRLNVGGSVNAGPAMIKFILDWQARQPVIETKEEKKDV